ncbi:hypothetical protein NTHI1209_02189 [Haemophilus influenzae]|uniref:Uncharacterized protein n=1 Tax=Haemophilus influenzae TaxID=727 RepID=A0A158T090_HAEIF|nr:hypothetical protein NTHI1209_02189 [Haemophilus influenzae]
MLNGNFLNSLRSNRRKLPTNSIPQRWKRREPNLFFIRFKVRSKLKIFFVLKMNLKLTALFK